jgi:hypothetical protein
MSSKRKWDQAAPTTEEESPLPSPKKPEDASSSKTASEAAAAAVAIAAKIAAQFASPGAMGGGKGFEDAEFTHDIDINDVRNRYMLTKGTTQAQVRGRGGGVATVGVIGGC